MEADWVHETLTESALTGEGEGQTEAHPKPQEDVTARKGREEPSDAGELTSNTEDTKQRLKI